MSTTPKKSFFAPAAFIVLFIASSFTTNRLTDDPWKRDQLLEPQVLANIIRSNKGNALPVIFNVGADDAIKGAISTGAASDAQGLAELKKQLKSVTKDKLIVIYCGCCPLYKCPNVRPAFKLLVAEGYTNIRVLNLKPDLKIDWIDKKYPMDGGK